MSRYCRVLIVDDEFIMRQGITLMLEWEKEGFQVVGEASNGREALELIPDTRPDIILADVIMPVMNGVEFSEVVCQKYPEIQLIMLSGYDTFDYVKKTLMNGAADYLLKTSLTPDMLLTVLKRVLVNIEGMILCPHQSNSYESQIARFLSGYQESLNETDFAEKFLHSTYRILALNIHEICRGDKKKVRDILGMIRTYFKQKSQYVIVHFIIQEHIACFVINFRTRDQGQFLEDVEACAKKVAQVYDRVFFVLSQEFKKLLDVKEYFEWQIMGKIYARFYYNNQTLFTHSGDRLTKMKRFDFKRYSDCLSHQEFIVALDIYIKYLQQACKCKMEEYKIKNLAKNLLYNYLVELEKYQVDTEDLRQEYFLKIDRTDCADDFLSVVKAIGERIQAILDEHIVEQDGRMNEIKKYIEIHYNYDLDLGQLAKMFGLNYSYLSYYFNQHVEQGFSGYLNQIRVKKACGFLKHSNKSISEISHEVGYSDHSYFCRVFKKVIGKSPRDYRKLHKGDL